MSAPAFGSIGTLFAATTSAPAFVVPASVASGDIIVVAFFADVSTTTISAFPAGFAAAENSPRTINAGNAGNHVLHVAWKRASGADSGTYAFTLSASVFVYGNAVRYTGGVGAGNPWDSPTSAADGGNTNSTTTPDVAINTGGPDRLDIFVGTSFSGDTGTWTPPSGFAERQGGASTTNCEISDKTQAVQGGSGNTHASHTVSDKVGSWLGGLIGTTSSTAPGSPPPRPPKGLFDQLARDYQNRFRPDTPAVQTFVAPWIGARRSIAAAVRMPRGQIFQQPPVQVVVTTPVFVPPQIGGRHPTAVRVPRGRILPPPSVLQVFVPPQMGVRHPVVPLGRPQRGRFLTLPPASVAGVPSRINGRSSRPFIRRGQIFPVPVPVVVITTGPWVPRVTRLAIHWPGAVRRGRILSTPVSATVTPPRTVRPAVRWPGTVRRGAIFSVPVPAAAVVPTGPVIPKTIRLAIHWPGPIRRGKIFFIPSSSQAAPSVTPVAPPGMIQQHQQTRVLSRRGKISPVFGGQPSWVPPPTRPNSSVGARGTRPGMTPRGRRWITPTTPTGPIPRPPIGPARRILAVRPPRGRFLPMPYPPAVVVPPPPYVARIMRQRARFWFFARRGRLQFTRLTGAFGFPAEFISVSSALDMIGSDSAAQLIINASTGSAEFTSGDRGVTFVDGDTGTDMRSGP